MAPWHRLAGNPGGTSTLAFGQAGQPYPLGTAWATLTNQHLKETESLKSQEALANF